MLILIIRILITVLVGQLLGQKEFLSYIGISYIVDMIYYVIVILQNKGKE